MPKFTFRTAAAVVLVLIIGAFIPGFFDEVIGLAIAYMVVK